MPWKNLCLFVITVFVTTADLVFAGGLSLGIPRYGGNGCPNGTVATVLSPDGQQLSVLFDAFSAEAGGSKMVDQKRCEIGIPLRIPQGISIGVVQMDYRGFSSVPPGAVAEMDVDTFFVNRDGPKHRRSFKDKTHGNFFITNKIPLNTVVWSPCGKDLGLRVSSIVRVRTNPAREQTMATIDSIDVAAGLTYQLQWKSCR